MKSPVSLGDWVAQEVGDHATPVGITTASFSHQIACFFFAPKLLKGFLRAYFLINSDISKIPIKSYVFYATPDSAGGFPARLSLIEK